MKKPLTAFLLLLTILLTACGQSTESASSGQTQSADGISPPTVMEGEIKVGEPAPRFVLEDTQGNLIDLHDLHGKAVIVNFWATWCGPCRVEMPELQAAFESHQEAGLQLIAIESQTSGSQEESASFLQEVGVTFPNVRDSEGVMEQHYIKRPAWPTTIFIDREGIIRYVQIGPLTKEFIEEQLNELGF